jgi:hypothetical protein
MSREDDDFVEDLVKNLPQGSSMSEFELKKFEKLIDGEIASNYPTTTKKPLIQRMSVAASVAAILVGVGLFATQNGSLRTNTSILPVPTPTVSETSNPTMPAKPSAEPSSTSDNSNSGNQGEMYGNENESTAKSGEVPVFRSKIDYETNFISSKKIVTVSNKPGEFTSLSSTQRNCAITLGVNEELLAFDAAFYGPDPVMVFYVGQKKSDLVVKIVSSACELIAEIQND